MKAFTETEIKILTALVEGGNRTAYSLAKEEFGMRQRSGEIAKYCQALVEYGYLITEKGKLSLSNKDPIIRLIFVVSKLHEGEKDYNKEHFIKELLRLFHEHVRVDKEDEVTSSMDVCELFDVVERLKKQYPIKEEKRTPELMREIEEAIKEVNESCR